MELLKNVTLNDLSCRLVGTRQPCKGDSRNSPGQQKAHNTIKQSFA